MRVRVLLLSAVLTGAACGDGVGPVKLMVGQWGGQDVGVLAEPQRVTIALPCSRATYESAIAPDAAGDFTLRDGRQIATTGPAPNVTLRGHVSGDQITLVVVSATPSSPELTLVATRNAPDVMTVSCAAVARTSP